MSKDVPSSSGGDTKDYEDLLEYAEELQKELDGKAEQIKSLEDQISELSRGQVGKGRKRVGAEVDTSKLDQQVSTLQEQARLDQATISDLRKKLADSEATVAALKTEKEDHDKIVNTKSKQVESLEKELRDTLRKSQSTESQSKDLTKQKAAHAREVQLYVDQNASLQEEIKHLEAKLKAAEEEKSQYEEALTHMVDRHQDATADRDNKDVEKAELNERIGQLEADLTDMHLQLQSSHRDQRAAEDRAKAAAQEIATLNAKHATEIAARLAEIQNLQTQNQGMKDASKVGQLQRDLDEANAKIKEQSAALNKSNEALREISADRDELEATLSEVNEHIEEEVAERVATERAKAKQLELAIESLKRRHADEAEHFQNAERERAELIRENDELKNWKAVYEAGNGLQQLSLDRTKVSDDNRRLSKELEQRTTEYSALLDAHNALMLNYKQATGKDAPQPEVSATVKKQQAVEGSTSQLHIQELEDQISQLEEDNSKLRKQLRTQMGSLSEKGFQYPGMTPDMLLKVNEFAANIRDGKVELPLDDRSRQLTAENKQLKADLMALNKELLKEEHHGGNSVSDTATVHPVRITGTPAGSAPPSAPQTLRDLSTENAMLKQRVAHMDEMLRRQSPRSNLEMVPSMSADALVPVQSTLDFSQILSANNDLILKEIESLRRAQEQHLMMPRPDAANAPTTTGRVSNRGPPLSQAQYRKASFPNDGIALPDSGDMAMAPSEQGQPSARFDAFTPVRPDRNQQQYGAQTPSPFWTPQIHRGGMPFGLTTPGTITHQQQSTTLKQPMAPDTPSGRKLLNDSLYSLGLPPEEWASEVKELYAQLVECLEQLFEREHELENQRGTLKEYETVLGDIKLQMTILYHDFAQRQKTWNQREQSLADEKKNLLDERDDLKLKLKRSQEMATLFQRESPASLEAKIQEMTRKVMIYEVNEAVLSRKFISTSEQLKQEMERRSQLQRDFAEMEGQLKQRVLVLEDYRDFASSQLSSLSTKLQHSIPVDDYNALNVEMSSLREDHLTALRHNTEAQTAALSALEKARELRSLQLILNERTVTAERGHQEVRRLEHELQQLLKQQQQMTAAASNGSSSSAEIARLVSDLAKYRGEAGRMEVELFAANRSSEQLASNLEAVLKEVDGLSHRLHELERREKDLTQKESMARRELVEMKLKYNYGLTREEKDTLKLRTDKLEAEVQAAKREANRHREVAEIAAGQANALRQHHSSYEAEIIELREYCAKLESRSDDEVIIGRLQRELFSTKASYKAFARKYQSARENLRRREMSLRILESQLKTTDAKHAAQIESYHSQLTALAGAVKEVQQTIVQIESAPTPGSIASTSGAHGVGHKRAVKYLAYGVGVAVAEISGKIDKLSDMAEQAVARATQQEKECRDAQAELEEALLEKGNFLKRAVDLEALLSQAPAKQQTVGKQLLQTSEELRLTKLAVMQQKRQIQNMRDELKHMRTIISQLETEVVSLERNKLESENQASFLLSLDHDTSLLPPNQGGKTDVLADMLMATADALPDSQVDEQTGYLTPPDGDEGISGPDSSALASVKKKAQVKAAQKEEQLRMRKELSDLHVARDALQGRLTAKEEALHEQEQQLQYYERLLCDHGLAANVLRRPEGAAEGSGTAASSAHRNGMMQSDEQFKIQAAATATINSLRALLDEKNRTIESYRDRLDQMLKQPGHVPTRAERKVDELLHEPDMVVGSQPSTARGRSPRSPFRGTNGGGVPSNDAVSRMTQQMENADIIIADKDRLVASLEQNLMIQTNQRERAELRCAEAIDELEAIKSDMLTVLDQLKASEKRCEELSRASSVHVVHQPHAPALTDSSSNPAATAQQAGRVRELERLLKAKDEKVKGYREIVVRLKEEFVKAEEEKALNEVQTKARHEGTGGSGNVSSEELRELRDKLATFREGLTQAKGELERGKKAREKLLTERQHADEELQRAQAALAKSEALLVQAQNAAGRYRKELEEAKKREIRLREKVKEFVTAGATAEMGSVSTHTGGAGKGKARIDQLERENELLKAQLAAVKRGEHLSVPYSDAGGLHPATSSSRPHSTERDREHHGPGGGESKYGESSGHLLNAGDGPADDLRQQLRGKWETEKKLQKRMSVLELRVTDLVTENEELRGQLMKGKDTIQSAQQAKEEMHKKIQSAARQAAENKRGGLQDLTELEQSRAKVFELEEQLQHLARRADVEQTKQIRQLTHQVSVANHRIRALEIELGESEERRKKTSAGERSNVRDSEDRFLREERLRDELDFTRRQRLELEAALLDRDGKAFESRFELEAATGNLQRLQRRVKELEDANRMLLQHQQQGGATVPFSRAEQGGAGGAAKATASSRREAELEGVVDSMKRVIEKLRADNERIRRGVVGGGTTTTGAHPASAAAGTPSEERKAAGSSETEKKLQQEKRRVKELEEELQAIQTKLRGLEDGGQKLAQRQQQVAQLRQALKKKDEDLQRYTQEAEHATQEKDVLRRRITILEEKMRDMSSSAQQQQHQGAEESTLRRLSAIQAENDVLRLEVNDMRNKLSQKEQQLQQFSGQSATAGGGALSSRSAADYAALKEENEKLRSELSAFDLEFFDEIENLKFAHAEAIKKLREYEGREGSRGRR